MSSIFSRMQSTSTRTRHDRTFRPRIETLESRTLLAVTPGLAFEHAAEVDFEDVGTALAPEDNWHGPDPAGQIETGSWGQEIVTGKFDSGGQTFNNQFTDWGGGSTSWAGWGYSNVKDSVNWGLDANYKYVNEFGSFTPYTAGTGAGVDGSATYGVAFDANATDPFSPISTISGIPAGSLEGAYFSNTTQAAMSMLNGDGFAKAFGGDDGTDEDFLLLTINGFDDAAAPAGTVEFYLADYRYADGASDYIVDDWTWVDLSSLQDAVTLQFGLTSDDNDPTFGMNTPAYFAMDGLSMWSQVVVEGNTAEIAGTELDDEIHFWSNAPNRSVSINGARYDFDAATIDTFVIAGRGGQDSMKVTGTPQNETALLTPNSVTVSTADYEVTATSVESIRVDGRAGNDNRAYLSGDVGDVNEMFVGREAYSYLQGPGYREHVSNFNYVEASMVEPGGMDRAYLYDTVSTTADDTFYGNPADSRIVLESGRENKAIGFDKVKAYASSGDDNAHLTGSNAADLFVAKGIPDRAYLKGPGYYNYAKGFDYVGADGGLGNDRAYLEGTPGDDEFQGFPTTAWIDYSTGNRHEASNFARVRVDGKGAGPSGDIAYLWGSPGNDTFLARPTTAYLRGPGFSNRVHAFDEVYADVTNGSGLPGSQDVAYLYDSLGNDWFRGRSDWGYLTDSSDGTPTGTRTFFNQAQGFDRIAADGNAGGPNTLDVALPPAPNAIDYIFRDKGGWV